MSDQEIHIKLFLSESPSASKKDFLADTQLLNDNTSNQSEDLPNEIIINQYTREPWCRESNHPHLAGESNQGHTWHGIWLHSVDKRGRIPGFINFLKARKKAAYGKFISPYPDEVTGTDRTALFLVPFEQPSFPSKEILQRERVTSVGDLIFVKYCFDEKVILPVKVKPVNISAQKQQIDRSNQLVQSKASAMKRTSLAKEPNEAKRTGGLLGSLLGAQERTNRNLKAVPSKRSINKLSSDQVNQFNDVSMHNSDTQVNPLRFTTSNQVIASFRSKIEKKLMSFQTSAQTEIKIQISHAEEIRPIVNMEEKEKVTMEVLKYIVFEQAEEIGEDTWVAAKEASEFTDEFVIAVYKEGYAPQEVLDEVNKGEMPDEAKQQQRAMREALNKEEKKKAKIVEEINMKKAFEHSQENMKRLNNVKRDRRSIEEIQRDMMINSKRSRS